MMTTVAPAPHLRSLGLVITIASLAAIAFATLLPEPPVAAGSHLCLLCGSLGGVDAVLNVFLFAPLGIGLALSGSPGKRAIFAMFALSALIEIAQFLVIPGRDSTIGDVLTNTLGGVLGFAIGRYPELWLRPPTRIARNFVLSWATIWLAIQAISNFGFALSLPDSQYYGQIGRALGNFATFPGLVLTAGVGDAQIPNTVLADSHRVRRLLLDGAMVTVTVVPAAPMSEVALIVRIADARQEEIVLLAQNGEALIFGVHTGAAVLGLRPPLFALRDAFPGGVSNAPFAVDTLRLAGRYGARGVNMNAQSKSVSQGWHIPVMASLGWTLWLPFQWFIEGTRMELLIGWLWTACLVIPLGYWSIRTNDSSRSLGILRQSAPIAVAGIALIVAGLVFVPHVFGLPAAPFTDWLATLAGIFVGYAFGARVADAIGGKLRGDASPTG